MYVYVDKNHVNSGEIRYETKGFDSHYRRGKSSQTEKNSLGLGGLGLFCFPLFGDGHAFGFKVPIATLSVTNKTNTSFDHATSSGRCKSACLIRCLCIRKSLVPPLNWNCGSNRPKANACTLAPWSPASIPLLLCKELEQSVHSCPQMRTHCLKKGLHGLLYETRKKGGGGDDY